MNKINPMNKILMRLCLPLVLTATLTACGNDDAPSSDSGANVVVAPSNEPTEAASEAPAPAATDDSGSGGGSGEVSEADARATALAAAGAGASVRKVERDDEDGRQVYKFDIAVGSTERKISVDRATGQIVKDETDNDTDSDTDNDTDTDTDN